MYYITAIDINGKILQTSSSNDANIETIGLVPNAYLHIRDEPISQDCYWDFNLSVWVACPEQPSLHHTFNWVTKQWEDLRTLQNHKNERNAYINSSRLAANRTYFTHLGKQIAADALSRSDIDAINGEVLNTGAFPAGWPGMWKCLDNTWLPITTVEQWKALFTSMVNQGTYNFGYAQSLKIQLEAATTPEEVAAVVW